MTSGTGDASAPKTMEAAIAAITGDSAKQNGNGAGAHITAFGLGRHGTAVGVTMWWR